MALNELLFNNSFRHHSLSKKKPSTVLFSCWSAGSHIAFPEIKTLKSVALAKPPDLDDKTLFLKTPHTYVTEHRKM